MQEINKNKIKTSHREAFSICVGTLIILLSIGLYMGLTKGWCYALVGGLKVVSIFMFIMAVYIIVYNISLKIFRD